MNETWFAILWLMITVFVVMDGWDFGAGALHYIVARNQEERRLVIAALGPLWSWHEVWLVATGGVLFVAFPRVLATGFPAYYLALFLVLWTLILRGISLEFRGHIDHPLWRSFADFVFAVANIVMAILIGAVAGNVLRGMPLAPDAPRSLPLFTNFAPYGEVGILDWYTLSVAMFALVCLSAHGAAYLAAKTNGPVYERSKRLSRSLWFATLALLVVVAVETYSVRPALFSGLANRPLGWVAMVAVAGGLWAIARGASDQRRFAGGCLLIAGLLGCAAASLFPVMLHSTLNPEFSVTAFNGASDPYSLLVAAIWWPVAFVLALIYFAFIAKHYRCRTELGKDTQRPY